MNRSIRGSLVTALTWALVLAFFFPVFWMILNGFKPESVASSVNPKLFFSPSTEGYQLAMDRGMKGYLLNSVTAAVTATIIAVVLAIPAAYALSIRRVKNVENALSFFISTRFMPLAAVVLPLFMILKTLGLLDNIYMLAVVYGAVNLPVAVWMMRSFFLEVPFEIIEAARVDGAGLGREIFRVALPLVLPGSRRPRSSRSSSAGTSTSSRRCSPRRPPARRRRSSARSSTVAGSSSRSSRRRRPSPRCRSSSRAGSPRSSSSAACRWEPSSDLHVVVR